MNGTARNLLTTKTLLISVIALFVVLTGSAGIAKQPVAVGLPIGGSGSVQVSGGQGGVQVSAGTGGVQISGGLQIPGIQSGLQNQSNQLTQGFQAFGVSTPSINQMAKTYIQDGNQSCQAFMSAAQGGSNITDPLTGTPLPGLLNSINITALPTKFPPTPEIKFTTQTGAEAAFLKNELQKMNFTGNWPTDRENSIYNLEAATAAASVARFPVFVASKAQAEQSAQVTSAGNALGEVAKDQATSAIDYCSKFMTNFTVDPNNPWNKLRDQLFVPIGILLLLPGAILSQVRAVVAAGSPVIGEMADGTQVCCFDGILKVFKGIFLIPATYLIVNWGVDVSKDLVYTCATEYTNIFGTTMYNDALCGEIRAFPNRSYQENLGGANSSQTTWPAKKITDMASLENQLFESKIDDPCSKQYSAPQERSDELMPSSAVFARGMAFGTNAALTAAWNVLCAFQQVYLIYLFLVGPVIAGLWVWPTRQLQEALPSWIEGVVTVCFWSLFWNTVILLMACYKGVSGETGTIMETAFNMLATMAVKYGFDFVGLVKAFGEAAGEKAMSKGGSGSGSKGGSRGKGSNATSTAAAAAAGKKAGAAAAAKTGQTTVKPTTTKGTKEFGVTETEAKGTEGGGGEGGNGAHGGKIANIHPSEAGNVAKPLHVAAALPPTAHKTANGHKLNGSASIHMPNGQKYSLSLSKNAKGQQVASVKDAKGHLLGSLNLAQGHSKATFHTGAGDIQLAAAAKGHDWNFSLTTADGKQGSLSLHNYLGEHAPAVNTAGLPSGVTAIANLGDTGTLVRQADGSLAVFGKDSALHPLVNGAVDINGNHIEVGYGNTSNGQTPFLEVAQMTESGMTDVAILSLPSGMIGSTDTLNALNLDGTTNPSGTMSGQIPVECTADGTTVASGTNYAYDAATKTFDVNGIKLPASVLSPELLKEAYNHVPGAEATLTALSQPGVADNLYASQYNADALQAVQNGLIGTGVDANTLYQAAVKGDPLAEAQVLSQEISANPQHSKDVADSLGLQDANILTEAATNPIAAAQVFAAEVQSLEATNPGYANQLAQELGVSQTVFSEAATNPIAAAQLYAAEVQRLEASNQGYEKQVAQELGVSPSVLTEAVSNPIAATQLLSAEVQNFEVSNPGYEQQICQQLGTSQAIFNDAASNPIAAAQVLSAEVQKADATNPGYEQQTCQQLGISQAVFNEAASNPFAAAQLLSAEVNASHSPDYLHKVASELGVSDAVLSSACQSPIAATQMVAAETMQSQFFAQETNSALNNYVSHEMLASAVNNPVAAAQVMGVAAYNDAAYGNYIAQTFGAQSVESIVAAANNPTIAAQLVGMEAAQNPGFAQAVAQSVPNLDQRLIREAGESVLAATQLAAAEAANNPAYAREISPMMNINSSEVFNLASQSSTVAARALCAEAASNPEYANYIANMLHVSPDVVQQAATNPLAAAEIVAAEARLHPQYAAYARESMQIGDTNLFHAAAQSPMAAAQVLGADANMHPLLAQELADALKIPANVVKQAAFNPVAATEIIAAQAARNMRRVAIAPPNYTAAKPAGTMQQHAMARTTSGDQMSAMIDNVPPPMNRMNESLQANMGAVQRGVRRVKQSELEAMQVEQGLAKIINANQTV